LQKVFSHPFSQNIWRILPNANPESSLWIIELRDTEAKKVSYALIDTEKQQLVWEHSPAEADWWSSLTAFSYSQFFLHNYRYPEIPEPTDLLAYDAENGELLWALPNHLMVKPLGNGFIEVATKAGEQFVYKKCEALTGTLSALPESLDEEQSEIILKEPVRYRKDNVYFQQLASFIENMTGGHKAVSIDYLEKRPYIMFSYYIYEQDKSIQYLLIVTDQKQLILHEQLSEEREGMGRATMMLKASTLVYLKNNNEFSSLTLS
jgi:hypothetical protein